jgi:hypothetical protein
MNAILETLCLLDFANIGWVVDLGDVSSGGVSASTQFVSVSSSCRSGRSKKLVFYTS